MIIDCPFCGPREHGEFSIIGDASAMWRPDPNSPNAADEFHRYMHERDNPYGEHDELWSHDAGCRSWLIVTRDTTNHRGIRVRRAEDVHAEATS